MYVCTYMCISIHTYIKLHMFVLKQLILFTFATRNLELLRTLAATKVMQLIHLQSH